MKGTKVVVLIIAVLLFLSTIYITGLIGQNSAGAVSSQLSNAEHINDGVIISPKAVSKHDKYFEVTMNLPVIQGLTDKTFQNQVNNLIESRAFDACTSFEKTAREIGEAIEKQGGTAGARIFSINYGVKLINDDLLMFLVTTFDNAGASGNETIDYYNIDKKSNRFIQLKDIFKPGVEYITIINNEIKAQIKDRLESNPNTYFQGDEGFTTISDDQGFYIEGDNLVIAFPKYSIAPGYVGIPKFNIPLKKLEIILSGYDFK